MAFTSKQLKAFKKIFSFDKTTFDLLLKKLAACKSLEHHSKKATKKTAFIALSGERSSPENFLAPIKNICLVIFLDSKFYDHFKKAENIFYVDELAKKVVDIALAFYNWPSEKTKVIGITGTNGKTSVSYILEKFYQHLKIKTGVIGTNNNRIGKKIFSTINTTPPVIDLQKMIRSMVDEKVQVVIMEISSHGLFYNRVQGIALDSIIWTNLTPEHLDFHKTMDDYFASKWKILSLLEKSPKRNKKAFINLPTLTAFQFAKKIKSFSTFEVFYLNKEKKLKEKTFSYAMESTVKQSVFTLKGIKKSWQGATNLLGDLNGENLALSLLEVMMTKGSGKINFLEKFRKKLLQIFIPGRLEKITSTNKTIFIDYAHTPDALEKVLVVLKSLNLFVICLFGCGGERDKTKRSLMGKLAITYADEVIVTSDNPRGENPEKIIAEIEEGIIRGKKSSAKKYYKITSRRKAIIKGLKTLKENQVFLIAGKGHEDYQIIQDKKIHFSDREVVVDYLKKLKI